MLIGYKSKGLEFGILTNDQHGGNEFMLFGSLLMGFQRKLGPHLSVEVCLIRVIYGLMYLIHSSNINIG